MNIAFAINNKRSSQKDAIAYGVIIAKKFRLKIIVLTLKIPNRTLTSISVFSERG